MKTIMNFYQIYLLMEMLVSLITFNESNIYKKQKIYENTFDYLEIKIKDQNNRNIEMKDFFQIICLYKLIIYVRKII